jgi:hypothetical protein
MTLLRGEGRSPCFFKFSPKMGGNLKKKRGFCPLTPRRKAWPFHPDPKVKQFSGHARLSNRQNTLSRAGSGALRTTRKKELEIYEP